MSKRNFFRGPRIFEKKGIKRKIKCDLDLLCTNSHMCITINCILLFCKYNCAVNNQTLIIFCKKLP